MTEGSEQRFSREFKLAALARMEAGEAVGRETSGLGKRNWGELTAHIGR